MTISKRILLLGLLGLSILCSKSVWASSKFINVQGKLTDTSGNPLTGSQTITFRLYTSSSAAVASAIWTESQTITLSTGLFNVALGTVTALDPLTFNQLYYLGIQVAGDANELSPRQQLGASAYAQGSLGNFNVGNNLVIGGTTTIQGSAFSVGGSNFSVSGGNVLIGGQAVIVGTTTLLGNSFSVGGASFTISGGSATVAYSLTTNSLTTTSSTTASSFFGDGSHLTNLSTSAVGAMLAGTIIPFGSSTVPVGFLECNGASYSTATYPVLSSRINCTWGCADSAHFNVPDLRGVFLRGWNHGISTTTYTGDFDAAVRSTITTGGNSGDKVGTYQNDVFASHTHTTTGFNGLTGQSGVGSYLSVPSLTNVSGQSGGNETRPKNASVMWLIKTDDTAIIGNGITVSFITAASSMTASAFFGDGSHLTGISASGGETNTYGMNGSSKTFINAVQISSGNLTIVSGAVLASSGVFTNGVTASSGTFTQTGSAPSIKTSSGIVISGGDLSGVNARFSGVQQLMNTSTVTTVVGYTAAGTTITVGQYPMTDFYSLIASTIIASGSAVAFNLDFTTGSYRIVQDYYAVSATTGGIEIQFNGDGGSNYGSYANDQSGHGQWSDMFNDKCPVLDDGQFGAYNIGTNDSSSQAYIWDCVVATPRYRIFCTGGGLAKDANAGALELIQNGCVYNGSAPLTNVRFYVSPQLNGVTANVGMRIKIYRSN